MSQSLEAKIVVLGSQGVGKTSLVHRYVKNAFNPATTTSTIGASFVTKRVLDTTTDTDVRLQIWDTAGQERFRSISRLYYRGANAGLLCYDITSEASFEEMKGWLVELKEQIGIVDENNESPIVIHVVGTKSDIVAEDPSKRKIPFERTIAYVAEQLYPSQASTPPATAAMPGAGLQSPDSKRSSGFWGQDIGWDSCHEVNAKDGEGIEEVFRVIARKLVEQRNKRIEREAQQQTPGVRSEAGGYFDSSHGGMDGHQGSFRIGYGDKRRSWLGLPTSLVSGDEQVYEPQRDAKKRGRCC